MIHVLRSIFQVKPKFRYFGNTHSHPEGPGVLVMDYVRDLIMTMLFSKYSWSLRMALRVSKIAKFGVALKIDLKNTYYMQIIKFDQLPDLIHDHVILEVHLDNRMVLKAPKTTKLIYFPYQQ